MGHLLWDICGKRWLRAAATAVANPKLQPQTSTPDPQPQHTSTCYAPPSPCIALRLLQTMKRIIALFNGGIK